MHFPSQRRRQHTDAGMTLPELLISVTLTAILATSLAIATNVMLSNRDNTLGRANNSRSEQNVGLFMPTDLASSESEDTLPGSTPCRTAGPDGKIGTPDDVAAACPAGGSAEGSNALLLTWTSSVVVAGNPVTTTTLVSYRVVVVGTEYQLIRVKCDYVGAGAPTCNTQIVLHDLTPPGVGVTFTPGVTPPDWIITVSKATAPDDTSGPTGPTLPVDPGLKNKNGQRVVVTVNGGGGGSSASGGQSQIFLSAGGTDRTTNLSTEDVTGAPTFTAARSRCGGNIGMIVDTSNSIWNSQMATIKAGIRSFLDEFAGTPVKLQIVTFSTTGTILGSTAGEPHWFDMLVDSDVQALKNLIGDPAQSGNLSQQTGGSPAAVGIKQNGGTNWEDGFLRMLKNVDGTVPAQLPSKIIFFTDGVPTFDRQGSGHTSSTAPVTVNPLDAGLPASTGGSYSQVGWNRAERVVRDRGKVDVIGVMVGALPAAGPHAPNTAGTDPAYESWMTASAGYHWAYARGDTVVYQKGYHLGYQRNNNTVYERGSHAGYQVGNNVVWERGLHLGYQVGNNVVWERGYHLNYERNNNVVFERSGTGLTYEKQNGGGSWSSTSVSNYFTSNTTPDSTDGWRVRVTGALGSWSSTSPTFNQAAYDTTNTTTDSLDGFRTRVNGSLSTSWTAVTAAQYNAANTTGDSTDGWRVSNAYSSPYDTWESTTQATYDTAGNNSTVDSTDGWRTRQTATSTSWTTATAAQYTASNSTADATDGWQTLNVYSTPFDSWASTTQATYDTAGNNSTVDSSDGWRTRQTATSTSWANVTAAQYNASNSTTDDTDGWSNQVYSSPYSTWASTTQATYDTAGNNSTVDSTDGWRTRVNGSLSGSWTTVTTAQYNASNTTADANDGWQTINVYSSTYDLWETTPQATYEANNTNTGTTDGWRTTTTATPATWVDVTQTQYTASDTGDNGDADGWRKYKSYTAPFSVYDIATKDISAIDLLGNVIVGDLSGNTGAYNRVDAPASGSYPDDVATAADVFALPNYTYFAQALDKIVLGECGGTVTLQTKNQADGLGAKDPFTYANSAGNTVVKTSSAFKSGTFDVAFPGENAKTITISPQEFTNLSAWSHVSWSCKSKGVAYPFTEAPVPNHTAWTSITLTVHANEAISCSQIVKYLG